MTDTPTRYVATQAITIGGARAYNAGDFVSPGAVARNELEDLVEPWEPDAAPSSAENPSPPATDEAQELETASDGTDTPPAPDEG